MLGIKNHLYFPSLVFIKKIILKHPESPREISIYKLNWNKMDEKLKQKHEEWNRKYWPNVKISYIESLPKKYIKILNNCSFAIDKNYLDEINTCSRKAFEEWNISRSFDTIIREKCLEPAISFIRVSFMLIADCLYDEKIGYFSRDNYLKPMLMLKYLMAYRFWCHQTGRGLIIEHSSINELFNNSEFHDEILVDEINKHQKKLNKAYEQIKLPEIIA